MYANGFNKPTRRPVSFNKHAGALAYPALPLISRDLGGAIGVDITGTLRVHIFTSQTKINRMHPHA